MKPKTLFLAFAVAVMGLALAPVAQVPVEPSRNAFAADEWKLPVGAPALKPAVGVEAINANCMLCHSLDYISTQPPLTRTQWTAGVTKMQAKFGAPISTNQIPALVEFLAVNYGKETPAK